MHFSAITLQGFKSFLDETTIPLEVGLTGIVGPNGCGKSNVVEALRWVMGESNARKVRGDDMDDIIFMGTNSRTARNVAEVTLNIVNDNAADNLPHPWQDLNELAVKRTLTRSAGSTYRINGKEVRGKDVQYLFMAQATGSSSASMVAQGRISNIINAKAGERRLVLEEAAGVRALSARRHESELKLDATNKTLAEVGNIIVGLETAQNKLLKDAKQAETYRALSHEIASLEVMILTIKHHLENTKIQNLEQELFSLQKEQSDLIANEGKTASDLATETERHLGLKSEMETQNQEFMEASRLLTELKAEEKRYQNELLLTRQRHDEIKLDLDNALKEINQSAEQERVLLLNCEEREKKFPQEEEKLQILHKNEQDILLALEANETDFAAKQKIFAEWLQEQSKASSELKFLQETNNNYKTQQEEKTKQLAAIQEKLSASSKAGDLKTMATDAEKKYNQAEKEQAGLQKNLDQVKKDWLAKKEIYQTELTRQQAALHQTELAHKETLSEISALKKILGEGQDDLLTLMEVANGFEKALAVALMDEAESGLEETKQQHWQGFGSEKLNSHDSKIDLPALLDKVSAPKPLARNLSLTYWVDNFADGKKYQTQLMAGEKIVSKDGGLIRWDGFTINPNLAGVDDGASRKLSAKNRLKKLDGDLPNLQKNNEQMALTMSDWQTNQLAGLKKIEEDIAQLEQKLMAVGVLAIDEKKQWQELQTTMMTSIGEQEQLSTTKKILTAEIDNLSAQIAKSEKTIAAHVKTHGGGEEDTNKKQTAINAEEEKLKQLRQQHIDAQLQFQQQQQLVKSHNEDLKNMHSNIKEVMNRKQEKEKQIILLKERLTTASDNIKKLSTLPSELLEKIAFQERTYQVKKEAQTALGEKLLLAENTMRDKNKELKEWQEKLSMLREKTTRAETLAQVSKDNLVSLAQESEGKDLITIEAVEKTLNEKNSGERNSDANITIDEKILSKQEMALRDNINKRERMGPVNLLADQNLQETATDIEKLSNEKKDLDEAVVKLQNAIGKLNSEARQKISEAFHRVNENFAHLFKTLFGGGEASLFFDGDGDPLTAGLEFTVHPPGKKSGRLSLLSGGEQTLTALALIFAVMDMNPPPIAVLDEVDAPLDDANIHRFTQLLRQRKIDNPAIRYLIITHHRLTMARMDRLFGITMAEKGLSTIVGVNLETAAALTGKKVA